MGAAGHDAAWPSIATDGDGKVWVNYARAGADECLSAYAGVIQPGCHGVRLGAHPRRVSGDTSTRRVWNGGVTSPPSRGTPWTRARWRPTGRTRSMTAEEAQTEVWQQVIAILTDV